MTCVFEIVFFKILIIFKLFFINILIVLISLFFKIFFMFFWKSVQWSVHLQNYF